MPVDISKIIQIQSSFQKSLHALDSDLNFWNHFITKWAIPEYQAKNPARVIHASAYSTYDNDTKTGKGRLKLHREIREIHSDNLPMYSDVLFNWVEGLTIVRVYNALEILLLQLIDVVYFNSEVTPLTKKKEINAIESRIRVELGKESNKVNNGHLIKFLKLKSPEFDEWINLSVRPDLKSTWDDYFLLISILRHVVAHQAMLINKDTINEINSKSCREVFSRHFDLFDLENDSFELKPVQGRFNIFIDFATEFAVNSLKIISKQRDINFLGLAELIDVRTYKCATQQKINSSTVAGYIKK